MLGLVWLLACGTNTGDTAGSAACTTVDADGDGYGVCPDGSAPDDDCDDTDPQVHPDAAERCDDIDDDCDGLVDADDPGDADIVSRYTDADLDGWGDTLLGTGCPSGTGGGVSYTPGDCDDDDAEVHPGATEVCDGVDNDCDGATDRDDPDVACDDTGA
jgi:hypothetical protein